MSASFVVVDDQQPGPSRQLRHSTRHLSPPDNRKTVNSTLLDYHQVFSEYSISTTVPADRHTTISPSQLQPALSPVPTTTQQEQARPSIQSSQQSTQISRLACIKSHQKGPSLGHPNLSKTIIQRRVLSKTKKN